MALPEACPSCLGHDCIVHFGSYLRVSCIDEHGNCNPLHIKRFRCKCCGKTISYLPSFLVPRKHFIASVVEDYFLVILYHQLSIHQAWKKRYNACEKTLRIWLGQFRGNFNTLKQELFKRTGIDSTHCDDIDRLYVTILLHYLAEFPDQGIFDHFQADLCSKLPGIGIFRPLLNASSVSSRGSP